MDTIDLDAILSSELNKIEAYKNKGLNVEQWKDKYPNFYGAAIRFARETIEQALVLASEKAQLKGTTAHNNNAPDVYDDSAYVVDSNGPDYVYRVDRQSILDVLKLIK